MEQGILLTGAAARISQEVALLDGLGKQEGLKIDHSTTYLAGFSSGSLNVAAINGCFGPEAKLNWDMDYKEGILFPLENSQVFKRGFKLPWDTSPLRKTLEGFLDSEHADLHTMKDLSFHSHILAYSSKNKTTCWADSLNSVNRNILLADLLMASTAIPILFPPQEIHAEPEPTGLPSGEYMDGGTRGIFDGFETVLKSLTQSQGPFDNLYIISPMRYDESTEVELNQHLLPEIFDDKSLEELKLTFGSISQAMFVRFLKKLKTFNEGSGTHVADNVYVSIPSLSKNFPLLDFNQQKAQYSATMDWIDAHPSQLATSLDEYLRQQKS